MKIFDAKLTGSIEFLNPVAGNIEVTGDLVVPGTITAREFHTEFTSASIIYASGSTQFGDTLDDVHNFTGSVALTGSLGITTLPSADLEYSLYFNNSEKNRYWNIQLSDTHNLAFWSYNGSSWNYRGGFVLGGGFNSQDYIEAKGLLYTRSNLQVINSSETGWNTWGTLSNGYYNLTANSLTTSDSLIFIGGGEIGIGTTSPSGLLNVNTGASGTYDAIVISRDTYGEAGVIKQAAGGLEVHSQKNLVLGADEDNVFTGTSSNIIFKVDGTTRGTFNSGGTLTIGDGTNSGRLQFENDVRTRKVVLYQGANNDNEFYGFGIESNTLVYSVYTSSDDHVFFSGFSGGRNELMRIGGDGNVGIGTTSPSQKLDVSGPDNYVGISVNNGTTTGGGFIRFQQNGTTAGLVGVNGSIEGNTSSDLGIFAETGKVIKFYTNGSAVDRMSISTNGTLNTSQNINIANYTRVGQTSSGAMSIFGHNVYVDTSTANRIRTTNTGYPSSWIKMYYTEGISFHTTLNTMTADDIVLDGTGANTYERMRVTPYGLTFNGDATAANALDDYEEGTWTPTFVFDLGNPSPVYSNQEGYYIKVGNLVTVWFDLRATNINSTSYYWARLGGLPFDRSNSNQYIKAPLHHSGNSDFSIALRGGTNPVMFRNLNRTDFARGNDVDSAYISGHFSFIAN